MAPTHSCSSAVFSTCLWKSEAPARPKHGCGRRTYLSAGCTSESGCQRTSDKPNIPPFHDFVLSTHDDTKNHVISAGPSCKCTYYSNISYYSLSFNTRRTNFHHINIQRLAVASNPICETKACTCTKS